MPVIGRRVKRKDIRLIRGDSDRVGGRWRILNLLTGEATPKDLSGWTGVVELRSPDGREMWWSRSCDEMTEDGYAVADIPPSAFTADLWAQRRAGQWKCRVSSPDGATVRTVGCGYWVLSD